MNTQPHSTEHTTSKVGITATEPKFQLRDTRFTFKKQTAVDELGAEIKRPPVVLALPIPTFTGLVEAFDNEKVQQFVLDLVEDAIKEQARVQVSDEDKPVNRQDELDLSKLTLEYIASIPKSDRAAGGISKEVWEAFGKDYVATIVAHTDRGPDKASKAASLLVGKVNSVKTDKPVLKFLQGQLQIWATKSSNLEDFAEVYQFLDTKISSLLNRDAVELLANL